MMPRSPRSTLFPYTTLFRSEPDDGCLHSPRPGRDRQGSRGRSRDVPAVARAALAARWHHVGRGAADARHGAGADVAATLPLYGRAIDGPRAGAGGAAVRDHPAPERDG